MRINGVRERYLVDTGAAVSTLSKAIWDKMEEDKPQLRERKSHNLVGIDGVPLELNGSTRVEVKFDGLEKIFPVEVQVAESIPIDVILGWDFLQQNKCNIRFGEQNHLEFVVEGTRVELGCGQKEEDTTNSDEIPTGWRISDLEVEASSTTILPMCVRCGGKMSQLGLVDAQAASLKKP